MTIAELVDIAHREGVQNAELFSEKQLVRAIQRARGHEICFLSDTRMECLDSTCEWRVLCRRLMAEWRR